MAALPKIKDEKQIELYDPLAPLSAKSVRDAAKYSRNDHFYDKLWTLCLFMAGCYKEMRSWSKGATHSARKDQDLGIYPEIDPEIGPDGVQNHALVNARINIQAIVYALPELVMRINDPLIREINQRWFEAVWEDQDLSGKGYEVGIDVETMGVGFMECGIGPDGGVTVEVFDPLDCLWDSVRRSPNDWGYFFRRKYLSVDDAVAEYGHLFSRDEIEEMCVRLERQSSVSESTESTSTADENAPLVLIEWHFWHRTTHCRFLRTINGEESIILVQDPNGKYQISDEPGSNPYGIVPIVFWYDSFGPRVKRTVGKGETVVRLAAMLNYLEGYVMNIVKRGLPVTTLSSFGLAPDDIERIREARTLDDVEVLVLDVEDAQKAVGRILAEDIPASVLQARAILKEELNAATGVQDAKRGMVTPGQRTAYEAQMIKAEGGTQSEHTRRCYEKFLRRLVQVLRAVAKFETKQRFLQLKDGIMDTSLFPIQPFVAVNYPIAIREESLMGATEEQRKVQRMTEFQTIDMAAIQLGVGDPLKIMTEVYRDIGVKDPSTRLYSMPELQAMAAQQMMMGAAGGGAPEEEGDPNEQPE